MHIAKLLIVRGATWINTCVNISFKNTGKDLKKKKIAKIPLNKFELSPGKHPLRDHNCVHFAHRPCSVLLP